MCSLLWSNKKIYMCERTNEKPNVKLIKDLHDCIKQNLRLIYKTVI